MLVNTRSAAALATALSLAGCVGLAQDRGYAQSRELVTQRRPSLEVAEPGSLRSPEIPTAAVGVEDAVQLAFFYNPRLQQQFARLGFARAELEDARRIANPSFGYLRLRPSSGRGEQITRSLSLGLTDLLMLPARKRYAEADLARVQSAVAGSLLELAAEVEVAWFEAVGAQQVANMRELVAQAADHSATLAQRFFDAGNITPLQNAQERAAADQARIDAVRAGSDALRARTRLAGLIGLPSAAKWRTQERLPAPLADKLHAEELVALALENRLDLSAAKQEFALRKSALGLAKRWGWLGGIELGAERERELDGARMHGTFVDLEVPLFNQGQGKRARARAELMQAQAELDALALAVRNDAQLGLEAMQAMHQITERYRVALVPVREKIVAESQKEQNFMLIGVFELLLAKQEEYDAYQDYLEAVRDYWIARSDLRKAVGGRLPDDGAVREPVIGVPSLTPVPGASIDPHAGHHMPPKPEAADPHAGHHMPEQAPSDDKPKTTEHPNDHLQHEGERP